MQWFIADTHFGHKNIIEYSKRPFHSVEHMELEIMLKWNERVKPEDTVWVLGDFSFGGAKKIIELLETLNGTKYLIRGNHDRSRNQMVRFGFKKAMYSKRICITDHKSKIYAVNLSHYPYRNVIGSDHPEYPERYSKHRLDDDGHFLLCAHIHEHWRTRARMINVGVDQWNFWPVSEVTICKVIENMREYLDKEVL